MALTCQFCSKSFNKGEHLRRHERGHTGHRPFTCPHCKRDFTRQDSLLRHQKVHARKAGKGDPRRSTSSVHDDDTVFDGSNGTPLEAFNTVGGPMSSSQIQVDLQHNDFTSGAANIEQINSNGGLQYGRTLPFQEGQVLSDLDLNLMWPDSEDLFQSIFSTDFSSSWQLPLGTLPLPSAPLMQVGSSRNGSLVEYSNNNNSNNSNSSYSREIQSNENQQPHADNSIRPQDNQGAVHGVSQMVSNYSSSLTAAVEAKSITSVFLDESLHMFFDRFIPIFPIMHRPTFVYRECSHALLLNAIAIGSLYLGPSDSVAKGESLWRLAHTAIATSWQTLIAHHGPYDACPGVQLVLSSLLSVIYGALSKNTAIRGASQALHASAFFWARQCGIFYCKSYDLSNLPSISAPHADKVHQWRIWAAREIQERALLSHFVFDGLIAHMQGNATAVRHTSNTLRLPTSERAFQDTTVDDWLQRMHSIQQDEKSFRDVYKRVFVFSEIPPVVTQGFSNFSLRVVLEALQSMISDSDFDDGAIINPPNRSEISHALSWIYEEISNCSDITEVERLEVLMRWHAVCLEAVTKTPQLCNYICKRWNAQQDLWSKNIFRDQEYDLPQLVSSPDGRKALLHAVAIQQIIEQLPRGRAHAVHMPSSLFAAATIYGIFSFAGQTNVRTPNSVKWKDVVLATADLQEVHHETANFIQNNVFSLNIAQTTSRNVFYELNSVQKLFRTLSTQWGVSADMEKVVSQWIAFCHS